MFYIGRRGRVYTRVLLTASNPRSRRHRPALEVLEGRLLLDGGGHSFYVAPGGSDAADGSALHPWATIQQAADSVAPDDTVHVAPGTYDGAITTEASGTSTDRITFISDVPWGAKVRTTGSDISWTNEGDYVDIQGFDITGDGLHGIVNYASYVRIVGNHVHDIPAVDAGSEGGSGIEDGNYSAHGTDIIGNVVNDIGDPTNPDHRVQGIYLANSGEHVWNNVVYRVQAYGIHAWHAATNETVANNLVFGCGAGGILIGDGDTPGGVTNDHAIVSNNIVINNHGYGIKELGQTGTHNRYLNNLVYGNDDGAFSLQNGNVDQSTVVAGPRFINYQPAGSGDYHLASDSPCIDAGTSTGAPTTDHDGVQRPVGTGVNIGPYEWVPPTATFADAGFEQVAVGAGQFRYRPAGSPWTFAGSAGISANGSGFTAGNPPAPEGAQVAFLQRTGSFSQSVAGWAAGSYVLTFDAAQRGNSGTSRQDFRVLVDGVAVGTFTPSGTSYQSFTTAAFTVAAGAHTIAFQGLNSAGGDNTAFIDAMIGDAGFERVAVGAGQFRYRPAGSPWTFAGSAGISANGSGFTAGNPPAPEGAQVAFLQKTGSFSQSVAGWAAGTYVLTFKAAQRGNFQASRQDFRVLVDGVVVGTFTPSGTSYQSFTTAAFTRRGRGAHDHVPGTEHRRRRQHRLHRRRRLGHG